MTDTHDLRDADRRRREAMIAGDVESLAALLASDMLWTHSSGRQDDKQSFLDRIAAGGAVYHELEVDDDEVMSFPEALIHRGNLTGRVSVEGREKTLRNRFLSVWRRSVSTFELVSWQSTGF